MPVFDAGEINLASLNVDDTYILIQTPVNTSIQGVDTGIVGVVGSASWGPLNAAVLLGSAVEAIRSFGPPVLKASDLPSDMNVLFTLQTQKAVGVRVADGTEAAASVVLNTAAFGTVTIGGVFHAGDITTITVTPAGGSAVATAYTAVAGDTNLAGVAASIALALNSNLAFAAIARATVVGAVITITSVNALNTTALAAAVTGAGATITATASAATLTGGGTSIGTFVARWTGTEGNNVSATASVNSASTAAAPLWDVTVARVGLVPSSETFTALPQATLATALQSALANGQGVARGPSDLARFTPAAGVTAPVASKVSLTGGANGDTTITTALQIGTNLAIPATGAYALKDSGAQIIFLSGNTDSTSWSLLDLVAKSVGAGAVNAFPANMSSVAAKAAKAAAGIDDWRCLAMVKDFVQYLDTANNSLRLVSPQAFVAARYATLTPEQSAGNKPIGMILNTERTISGIPYTSAELGLLADAGITLITNPVPAGNVFGMRNGLNSSSNKAINGGEYTRMTNFLAYSLVGGFGEFIDALQTQSANDPTRGQAKTKLNLFLQGLKSLGYIEDFSVDMSYGDGKVNTAQSVIDGFMKAVVRVKYKSVVRFFVVTLVGGKTVDVSVT